MCKGPEPDVPAPGSAAAGSTAVALSQEQATACVAELRGFVTQLCDAMATEIGDMNIKTDLLRLKVVSETQGVGDIADPARRSAFEEAKAGLDAKTSPFYKCLHMFPIGGALMRQAGKLFNSA
eukprot:1266625-Pyramimonas_sp.AAC.1